jgi:hypothetical protein
MLYEHNSTTKIASLVDAVCIVCSIGFPCCTCHLGKAEEIEPNAWPEMLR